MKRTKLQLELEQLGWRLAHTSPLHQSWHFERFVGRRRVAMVILIATRTARAWRELAKLVAVEKARASW